MFDKMPGECYKLRDWASNDVATEKAFKPLGLTPEWRVFKKNVEKAGVHHV